MKSLAIGNDTLKRTDRCTMHYLASPKPKLDWDGGREADELPLGGFWTVYSLSLPPLPLRSSVPGARTRRTTKKRRGRVHFIQCHRSRGRSPGPTFDPFCSSEMETGLKETENKTKLFATQTVGHGIRSEVSLRMAVCGPKNEPT